MQSLRLCGYVSFLNRFWCFDSISVRYIIPFLKYLSLLDIMIESEMTDKLHATRNLRRQ